MILNKLKKLVLNELRLNQEEEVLTTGFKGHAIVRDLQGNLIYEDDNKVVLAGSTFTASKHFDIDIDVWTPSYNEILGLENNVADPGRKRARNDEKIYLFAVGIDGCGESGKDIKTVKYASWISPDNLIPFRYQNLSDDLNAEERKKYFGRKVIEGQNRVAYYFKKFEAEPVYDQKYIDGHVIDENVYTSTRTDEINSVTKLHLIVSPDDCKEFFNQTLGLEEARLSSISLLSAYPKVIDGITYYQEIRPVTKYHFANESLIDISKGLDITYLLYY